MSGETIGVMASRHFTDTGNDGFNRFMEACPKFRTQ